MYIFSASATFVKLISLEFQITHNLPLTFVFLFVHHSHPGKLLLIISFSLSWLTLCSHNTIKLTLFLITIQFLVFHHPVKAPYISCDYHDSDGCIDVSPFHHLLIYSFVLPHRSSPFFKFLSSSYVLNVPSFSSDRSSMPDSLSFSLSE